MHINDLVQNNSSSNYEVAILICKSYTCININLDCGSEKILKNMGNIGQRTDTKYTRAYIPFDALYCFNPLMPSDACMQT